LFDTARIPGCCSLYYRSGSPPLLPFCSIVDATSPAAALPARLPFRRRPPRFAYSALPPYWDTYHDTMPSLPTFLFGSYFAAWVTLVTCRLWRYRAALLPCIACQVRPSEFWMVPALCCYACCHAPP